MELRAISRGALAGLIAGILGFVFTKIFAEPVVQQAIDYESGRGEVLDALRKAGGLPVEEEGPEIFSRSIQSTVGVATGIIGVAVAMGLIVAVAYVLLRHRTRISNAALSWAIAAFGFLGIFLLPFGKYPSNPPAIGHDFTIVDRGRLYLAMVVLSLVLLGLAVLLYRALAPRLGGRNAAVVTFLCALVVYGVMLWAFPSLGNLSANVQASHDLGFARAATETPQPITNTLGKAATIDGNTYAPGQIVYPGFDADLLWKFRWYSIINQAIIWTTLGLLFGAFMGGGRRVVARRTPDAAPRAKVSA